MLSSLTSPNPVRQITSNLVHTMIAAPSQSCNFPPPTPPSTPSPRTRSALLGLCAGRRRYAREPYAQWGLDIGTTLQVANPRTGWSTINLREEEGVWGREVTEV